MDILLKSGFPYDFSLAIPDLLSMLSIAWHGSVSKLIRRISFEQWLFKSQEAESKLIGVEFSNFFRSVSKSIRRISSEQLLSKSQQAESKLKLLFGLVNSWSFEVLGVFSQVPSISFLEDQFGFSLDESFVPSFQVF